MIKVVGWYEGVTGGDGYLQAKRKRLGHDTALDTHRLNLPSMKKGVCRQQATRYSTADLSDQVSEPNLSPLLFLLLDERGEAC